MELTKEEKERVYSIKHLFQERRQKAKPKFTFKDIAKPAAKKGQRRNLWNQNNEYSIAKLFRNNRNSYSTEKVREYSYSMHNKFNTTRSEYKIYGDVDIFHVQNVVEELTK